MNCINKRSIYLQSLWSKFSDVCTAGMCMLACQYTEISYLYIVQQHLVYNFFCISSNTKTKCNHWVDVVIRFDSRNLISLLNPSRQSHFKRFFNWKLSHITGLATIIAVPQVLPLSHDGFWPFIQLPSWLIRSSFCEYKKYYMICKGFPLYFMTIVSEGVTRDVNDMNNWLISM